MNYNKAEKNRLKYSLDINNLQNVYTNYLQVPGLVSITSPLFTSECQPVG